MWRRRSRNNLTTGIARLRECDDSVKLNKFILKNARFSVGDEVCVLVDAYFTYSITSTNSQRTETGFGFEDGHLRPFCLEGRVERVVYGPVGVDALRIIDYNGDEIYEIALPNIVDVIFIEDIEPKNVTTHK